MSTKPITSYLVLFLLLSCLLPARHAYAEWTSVAGTVQEISVEANGSFWFRLAGNLVLCTDGENAGYVKVGANPDGRGVVTQAGASQLLSTVMAALLAEKKVLVWSDKLEGWGCGVGGIKITAK